MNEVASFLTSDVAMKIGIVFIGLWASWALFRFFIAMKEFSFRISKEFEFTKKPKDPQMEIFTEALKEFKDDCSEDGEYDDEYEDDDEEVFVVQSYMEHYVKAKAISVFDQISPSIDNINIKIDELAELIARTHEHACAVGSNVHAAMASTADAIEYVDEVDRKVDSLSACINKRQISTPVNYDLWEHIIELGLLSALEKLKTPSEHDNVTDKSSSAMKELDTLAFTLAKSIERSQKRNGDAFSSVPFDKLNEKENRNNFGMIQEEPQVESENKVDTKVPVTPEATSPKDEKIGVVSPQSGIMFDFSHLDKRVRENVPSFRAYADDLDTPEKVNRYLATLNEQESLKQYISVEREFSDVQWQKITKEGYRPDLDRGQKAKAMVDAENKINEKEFKKGFWLEPLRMKKVYQNNSDSPMNDSLYFCNKEGRIISAGVSRGEGVIPVDATHVLIITKERLSINGSDKFNVKIQWETLAQGDSLPSKKFLCSLSYPVANISFGIHHLMHTVKTKIQNKNDMEFILLREFIDNDTRPAVGSFFDVNTDKK